MRGILLHLRRFQKSRLGLLSDVSVNKETIAEGDPAFSEWLKQSEIKTFEHVADTDDFVNAGDDLATTGVPTDNYIIDAVLQKEGSDQDSNGYIEESVPTKPLVTYSQAQDAVQTIMNSFENSQTMDDSTFNVQSVIKINLKRHQSKIDEKSFRPNITFQINKVIITFCTYLYFKIIFVRF
jgi:hypothetical protein